MEGPVPIGRSQETFTARDGKRSSEFGQGLVHLPKSLQQPRLSPVNLSVFLGRV